ncbi:S8 family peptidase [Microbaculum marinum]|uniref:S8 family serine peptidase n=1 Tax=Microbaculum marinum TaxID=1764581 RepID=A0AAW9RXM9_9HYPH
MSTIADAGGRSRSPGRRLRVAVAAACAAAVAAATGVASSPAAAAIATPQVFVADGNGGKVRTDPAYLVQKAESQGEVPVIVTFDLDFAPEGELSSFQAANQRVAIASMADSVLNRVGGEDNVKRFDTIPALALTVNAAGVRSLLNLPSVVKIAEDTAKAPTLVDSVPIIKANKLWKRKNKTGKGWVVAVLDTGVDLNHQAFRRKIVSQACYSTTNAVQNSTSVCPRGKDSAVGGRSGKYCSLSITGCDHGTHVSGIAVGKPRNRYKGVAKQADLIPIQVFSKFTGSTQCGDSGTCVKSYDSDQMKALERVYKLRKRFKIASVNMSLGGGAYTGPCDSASIKPVIDNLVSRKVAVVIASGNNGYDGAISSPACISSAIAVGSTTKSDGVSWFSNHSALVDLMAPGSDIEAPVPKRNKLGVKSGTSMATPHVAGAWALMKHSKPKAKVHEVLRALACTGKEVERAGITKPRIDVFKAYRVLRRSKNRQTWTFKNNRQVKDWEDELGNWRRRGNNLYVHGGGDNVWLAATSPFCASGIRVVAKVKRIDKDTATNWNSGLFLYSRIDDDKNMSGLWFAYNKYDDRGRRKRGQAVIWRVAGHNGITDSGGDNDLLCLTDNVRINEQRYNKLKVVSKGGVHRFILNNREVCSAADATFKTGDVAMVMASPGNDRSHKYFVNYVQATQLKAADIAVASGPATTPLEVPSGASPLGAGLRSAAAASTN